MSGNPRRVLHWNRVRGIRGYSSILIATALGAGLMPAAPGTFGTLVGIPISYFTNEAWPASARIVLWLAIFGIGTWSAKNIDQMMGSKDNQNIVIDEVVGYGITAWTAGTHPLTLIAAFFAFRLFDVWKPWPVRLLDRWSHSHSNSYWWSGFGVMIDDVGAGVQGLILILVLQHFGILPVGTSN